MSSIVPTREVRAYRHASDLPKEAWRTLMQVEAPANIILPFAKKATALARDDNDQFWIVVFDDAKHAEFVLSCTTSPLGRYPIFIVASKSAPQLAQETRRGRDIADALTPLVRCLLEQVPPQRVFSVFSTAQVTAKFAEIFVALTGLETHEAPYYDATFTYCTAETFVSSVSPFPGPEDTTISLCRANMSHLAGVAALCKAFSETSPPFELDNARAEVEAKMMIENQQAWVHLIEQSGREPEIACLIATTRESDTVTAVTKVFTAEHWRGRGCAARLLHRVCQDILRRKKRIVLYVGNSAELASARKVYHKIGFQGLNAPQSQQVKDVERWVEIGFKDTDLGYW